MLWVCSRCVLSVFSVCSQCVLGVFLVCSRCVPVSGVFERKTRMWNRAGARLPNIDDLGAVETRWHQNLPVGNDFFVRAASTVRVEEESKLRERIGWVPDVQCAGPRCHHWLRTAPPQSSIHSSHDSGCGRQWRPCWEGYLGTSLPNYHECQRGIG